jgi:flagellar M-ring protein FliF
MMIGVGLAAAGLVLAVSKWASQPTWVPAFTGVPLESVSAMTEKLDQAGVVYRLERGGADVMVAAADLAKARVALAKGGLPGGGRPGLELFDQPSWGMTDFTQRINYRRALQGELEKTIGKMRGIESAVVNLVMHETDGFGAANRPSEASVVIKTRGEASPDVVRGIAHLVASSVEGLTSDHVTIVDDTGRLLSEADEPQSTTGLSSRNLNMTREVEEYLREKAERMVSQIVGTGNAKVQVNATLNFDRLERLSSTVDPNKQAVSTEQKAEISPDPKQGGAGQLNTNTQFDNTKINEAYVAAPGSVKRMTVAVLVADKMVGAAGRQTSQARTPAELAQIKTLVESAVGADSARGDVVSVIGIAFAPAAIATQEPGPSFVETAQQLQRPVLSLLGLAAAVVIAFMGLKSAGKRGSSSPALLSGQVQSAPALAAAAQGPAVVGSGIRDRVANTIEGHPDVAARVIRAWLKEA